MKKRLLSLLVAISMVLTFLPVSALTAAADGSGGAKLEIAQGGYPNGSNSGSQSCSGTDWSYDKDTQTLTLSPSTPTNYDFSNNGIHTGMGNNTNCNLIIGQHATVTDGFFRGAVTNLGTITGGIFTSSVSNESDGTIENGTFRSTVTNNATINGGTFQEISSISGSGKAASGYTLTATMPTGFDSVSVNGYGNSCYVIPNQASVSVDISYRFEDMYGRQNLPPLDVIDNAQHMLLSDWCGGDLKIEFDRIVGGAYKVTFTAPPAKGSTVTISPLTRLVIDKAGYPVGTEGGTQDYSGNGWRFEKSNKTLTLESGDYSFWEQSEVECPVIIKDGVTTIGGMFSKKVTNYGTVEKAVINNIFENHNTVKNSYFFNSLSSIAVTNHGGTMLDCLFENAPEGIESHTITEVEDYFIFAALDGIAYQAVQTKFYFTGTPKLRVNLVKDGHAKPVTSINQKLNYGDLIEDSNSSPVSYIFTVENDNEDVVLNQGTYPTLKMASNGTPIIDGAYYSTIESNIPTYFGDGWHCQKAMDSVGTLYLEKGTYDFRSTDPTDPVNKNGEPLNAVICSIVNEGGTIEDGTFSKPIVNGQSGSTSSKTPTIKGGTFAAGLYYNNGEITGGAFNGKDSILPIGIGLSGNYRSVTVNGGAIVKVNDTHPLVPGKTVYDLVQGSAWDLYSYAGTVLTVESNVDITNINGQKIREAFNSYYPNGETDKTVVCFEMPDSDVELNSTKIVVPDPKPEPETPTYTLTVKGGTFTYNGGEAMTSASVPVDAEVKVTLNQSAVPEGMVFDLWAMDEASLLGNPAVAYNEESFTIPAGSVAKGSTVTVEAQYRDATIESEPSILGTAAIIGVAGAGTAVIVWQGYRIGMELYEKYFQPTPEETVAEEPALEGQMTDPIS